MDKKPKDWVSDVLLNGVESMFKCRPPPRKEPMSEADMILERMRARRRALAEQDGKTE